MNKSTTPDPGAVALSTAAYRLLLTFYPIRLRREYGPHMAQVFRDCCLKTYRQSGISGMLALWVLTLFDWFKTVVEEQSHRGTEMTRTKFIRLSGWLMILGALAIFVGIEAANSETSIIKRFVFENLGSPDRTSQYSISQWIGDGRSMIFLFASGLILVTIGLAGMHLRYGDRIKFPALILSIGGGAFGSLGGFLIGSDIEIGWVFLIYGLFAMSGFLLIFGMIALREKPMTQGNWLPILAGFWFPLIQILSDSNVPYSGEFILFLGMSISLLLLGFTLQADASIEESSLFVSAADV